MAFTRKAAIGLLRRAHDQKRLGHAYLISGPAGSGKREVAAELASTVNGTHAGDVCSSKAREIFVAEPESKSRRILIQQIRELEHGLQMRGAGGRRKVAIIAEADRLQPLAANGEGIEIPERAELVELLRDAAREKNWSIQQAYRVAQGMQSLLSEIREQIRAQTANALKDEEARYRNSTDGAWLDDREDYYKALAESLYIQRRAALVEVLLEFWSDVLRACSKVARRDLSAAKKETAMLADRFSTPEVLRRIQRLEELRDNLGRNIQEALAFEVAFLDVFGS